MGRSLSLRVFLFPPILLILTHHLPLILAITSCYSNVSSISSEFISNLRTLLFSLPQKVDQYGFYNNSIGLNPNIVYGSVLCRADVQPNVCRTCIQSATIEIMQSCPTSMQATTWAPLTSPFDYFCMVRYSNESLFMVLSTSKQNPGRIFSSGSKVANPDVFNRDLANLLQRISDKAARGDNLLKVGAGEVNTAGYANIYLLLQCTPDLSKEDCQSCLKEGIQSDCRNDTWCMVLLANCNCYYWTYKFYNDSRLKELLTPPLVPTSPLSPPPGKGGGSKSQTTVIAIVTTVVFVLSVCGIALGCIRRRKKKLTEVTYSTLSKINRNESLQEITSPESLQYDFEQIKVAVCGFSDAQMLGKGGFGAVYQGKLPNGKDIAVKRLGENSGQGVEEFKNEVLLVANLQHKNLVKLLGFSIQGKEKLVIYEFVENTSLDKFLFDKSKRSCLPWETRYNIITGIAKGLLYLHEDSRDTIVHRDLKSGNILLDLKMNPKIADFGIARQFVPNITHAITTTIVGTNGYMAPEYVLHGEISTKSDVFSFGVLIIEIISGQRNNSVRDGVVINIVNDTWTHWLQGTVINMIDPILDAGEDKFEAIFRCVKIGLLCVQENPNARPKMTTIVQMLASFFMPIPIPIEPSYFNQRSYDEKFPVIEEGDSVQSTTQSTQRSQ